MLTSNQRAQLKSMAATLNPVIYIGKNGVTENVIQEAVNNLKAHELIKGRVLENSLLTSKEALQELAVACCAEPVQAIGSKFILYKENKQLPVEKRISLVRK